MYQLEKAYLLSCGAVRGVSKGGVLERHAAFEVGDGERANQGREREGEQVLDAVRLPALPTTALTAERLPDVGNIVGEVLGVVDGVVCGRSRCVAVAVAVVVVVVVIVAVVIIAVIVVVVLVHLHLLSFLPVLGRRGRHGFIMWCGWCIDGEGEQSGCWCVVSEGVRE